MWAEWNSERYYKKTPTQKVQYMKPILLPATRTNEVRETMIQLQNISAECTIITYDLAIAKVTKQIQCKEQPSFDSIFIIFVGSHVEPLFLKQLERS